jgi:HMG box factor
MDLLNYSPDQKRRRFNNDIQSQRDYVSSSPSAISDLQSLSRSDGPVSAAAYRQQQLPKHGALGRGTIGSPSQSPVAQQARHHHSNFSNTFDESLRLPPLQTQAVSATAHTDKRPGDSQARSVEAMVMSIPYVNKIKLLWKISPPLKLPGGIHPAPQTRGAVFAVEGADKALLTEVGDFIEDYLRKEPSCAVQTWGQIEDISSEPSNSAGDTEMHDISTPSSKLQASSTYPRCDPFIDYLSVITNWHKRSHEITRYITTQSTPTSIASGHAFSSVDTAPRVMPVALIPRGFSLSVSDEFATRIPITDSYAPVDHWQWMATLWRGIIGPDLTIYTKRVDRDELDRIGGVEVRSDCRGIIVRVLETERINDKTSRRLRFEIMEIIHGFENIYKTNIENNF